VFGSEAGACVLHDLLDAFQAGRAEKLVPVLGDDNQWTSNMGTWRTSVRISLDLP
jgi:hypothetical protein